jgi:hypothetical protein
MKDNHKTIIFYRILFKNDDLIKLLRFYFHYIYHLFFRQKYIYINK